MKHKVLIVLMIIFITSLAACIEIEPEDVESIDLSWTPKTQYNLNEQVDISGVTLYVNYISDKPSDSLSITDDQVELSGDGLVIDGSTIKLKTDELGQFTVSISFSGSSVNFTYYVSEGVVWNGIPGSYDDIARDGQTYLINTAAEWAALAEEYIGTLFDGSIRLTSSLDFNGHPFEMMDFKGELDGAEFKMYNLSQKLFNLLVGDLNGTTAPLSGDDDTDHAYLTDQWHKDLIDDYMNPSGTTTATVIKDLELDVISHDSYAVFPGLAIYGFGGLIVLENMTIGGDITTFDSYDPNREDTIKNMDRGILFNYVHGGRIFNSDGWSHIYVKNLEFKDLQLRDNSVMYPTSAMFGTWDRYTSGDNDGIPGASYITFDDSTYENGVTALQAELSYYNSPFPSYFDNKWHKHLVFVGRLLTTDGSASRDVYTNLFPYIYRNITNTVLTEAEYIQETSDTRPDILQQTITTTRFTLTDVKSRFMKNWTENGLPEGLTLPQVEALEYDPIPDYSSLAWGSPVIFTKTDANISSLVVQIYYATESPGAFATYDTRIIDVSSLQVGHEITLPLKKAKITNNPAYQFASEYYFVDKPTITISGSVTYTVLELDENGDFLHFYRNKVGYSVE